jgi:hypothetical protein
VVSISSGPAARPGGGSGRGPAQAVTAIPVMTTSLTAKDAKDAKELQQRTLFTNARGVDVPLRPLRLISPAPPTLTSIAIARKYPPPPIAFIADVKRSVAANGDPLGLVMSAS